MDSCAIPESLRAGAADACSGRKGRTMELATGLLRSAPGKRKWLCLQAPRKQFGFN